MIERHKESTFHLATHSSSYVVDIAGGLVPVLRHWGLRGASAGHADGAAESFAPAYAPAYAVRAGAEQGGLYLEALCQEYGLPGAGDFRRPALHAVDEEGYPVTELTYRRHRLAAGAATLEGLPAVREPDGGAVDTLEIELADDASGISVVLCYTVFESLDVIARHVRIRNDGVHRISLARVMSASVDLPAYGASGSAFELVTLTGAWGSERHLTRTPLSPGIFITESTRGTSSHRANPFAALLEPAASERSGEVYAAALLYSGNFHAEIDASLGATAPRLNIGINPQGFRWLLAPGEVFTSPQAVLVFTNEGLGGMSRRFHELVREGILPPGWAHRERPVLLNTWEAQYFDVSQDAVLELADAASEVGVELLVLDDGWFAGRDDDTTSLGDWWENPRKLPEGLAGLARRLHERGLGFGLWVEPEMVSPQSELYRAHPDWCLEIPARGRGMQAPLGRNQLVLDLCRRDVQNWIIETFAALLERAGVDYVKWDMNRSLAPAISAALEGARRGEAAHRYVLGLYRVIGELAARFPDILFESCAGGGGRFDLGMLAFMPQTWTSDNTDAVSRLFIQHGTSLVYPPVTMCAHVSAVPNHQVGRTTPLATRGAVAMSANYGLELDLRHLGSAARAEITRQISFYKQHRRLVQLGRFLRLESPFEGSRVAWMFTDAAAPTEALLVAARHCPEVLAHGHAPERIRLPGLEPAADYEIQTPFSRADSGRPETAGPRFSGAELGARGLPVRFPAGDWPAIVRYLRRV
jgi:alpha-galactosidase